MKAFFLAVQDSISSNLQCEKDDNVSPISIICPVRRISEQHSDMFQNIGRGVISLIQPNIILTTARLITSKTSYTVSYSPLDKMNFDLVLLDEAHIGGNNRVIIETVYANNINAKYVLLSASRFDLSQNTYLSFSRNIHTNLRGIGQHTQLDL